MSRIVAVNIASLIVTVAVFAADLISPSTGWIARLQLKTLVLHHADLGNALSATKITAADLSNVDAQIAYADMGCDVSRTLDCSDSTRHDYEHEPDRVALMRAIERRFQDKPEVYAAALDRALSHGVRINRGADEKPLASTKGSADMYVTNAHDNSSTEDLVAFLHDAETGQQLDPDNAYFGIMRTIALFALHRDTQAEAAVENAGSLPKYEDYIGSEIRGRDILAANAVGSDEALARETAKASTIYGAEMLFRDLARLVIARAIVAEQGGDFKRGFALRRAVRQLGSKMRYSSTSVIGSLVGRAFVGIAESKPGGQNVTVSLGAPISKREQLRIDAYSLYLRRIGEPTEAAAFANEILAEQGVKSSLSKYFSIKQSDMLNIRDVRWWVADMLVPINMAFMLVCVAAGWILRLTRLLRAEQGWSVTARWALWTAAATLIATMLASIVQEVRDHNAEQSGTGFDAPSYIPNFLLLFGISLGVSMILNVAHFNRPAALLLRSVWLRRVWAALCGICVLSAVTYALYSWLLAPCVLVGCMLIGLSVGGYFCGRWRCPEFLRFASGLTLALPVLASIGWGLYSLANPLSAPIGQLSLPNNDPVNYLNNDMTIQACMAAALVVMPILFIAFVALFGRRGRPASVAIVRALQVGTVPVIAFVAIGYAVMVNATAHIEAVDVARSKAAQSWEGPYMAAQVHMPWPGPVP